MTLLWCITSASLLVALVALGWIRQLGRRMSRLTEQYWELKYQNAELRALIQRPPGTGGEPGSPARRPGSDAIIPLSSLRR